MHKRCMGFDRDGEKANFIRQTLELPRKSEPREFGREGWGECEVESGGVGLELVDLWADFDGIVDDECDAGHEHGAADGE